MHRGNGTTYNLLEQSKIWNNDQARDPKHNVTAQDDGPPASHRLATVHPFTVSPSGPYQGEQLGQGELFYKGELLVIPLYTNSNTDKLTMGLHPLTFVECNCALSLTYRKGHFANGVHFVIIVITTINILVIIVITILIIINMFTFIPITKYLL